MKNCLLKRVIFVFVFLSFSLSRGLVNASLQFQFVSVNNERVELTEENEVFVRPGDAVRISGYVEDKLGVKIFLGDKELEPIVSEEGRWYVLFSITEMQEGEYEVVGRIEGEEDDSFNMFLIVQEDMTKVLQASDNGEYEGILSENGIAGVSLGVVSLVVVIVVGLFGGLYYFLNVKGSKSKIGSKKKRK